MKNLKVILFLGFILVTLDSKPITKIEITFREKKNDKIMLENEEEDRITFSKDLQLRDYDSVKRAMIDDRELKIQPNRMKRNIDDVAQNDQDNDNVQLNNVQLVPTRESKFYPEYGLLLNNHGYIVPGIRRTYLFVAVKIPKPRIFKDKTLPPFPSCRLLINRIHGIRQRNRPGQRIKDELYTDICYRLEKAYNQVINRAKAKVANITHKLSQYLPAFLPNPLVDTEKGDAVKLLNGDLWYTNDQPKRQKREFVAAATLALTAINVLGGLGAKAVDTYTNYKRGKALRSAVEVLYDNDEKFHHRINNLANNTGILAYTTATGLQNINHQFNVVNKSINRIMTNAYSQINTINEGMNSANQIVFQHEIAIRLLGNGSMTLINEVQRYLDTAINYDKKISAFLDGLDEMSTGRLCFEILDPVDLKRYLIAIERDLDDRDTQYQLAFPHVYQYYAEPMITFTNSPDYILIQIPILLKYKFQVPMSLYSTDVVPVPYGADAYLGVTNEFTLIQIENGYIAISENEYAPMTENQLRLCWKLHGVYYCEHSYLMISKEVTTCVSAIYYQQNAKIITQACKTTYTQNKYYPPKIMDTGKYLVLSNLPSPWYLLCEYSQRPQTIEYSTYRIIEKKDLCECSLAASTQYLINKALADCPAQELGRQDVEFKTYYAFNKIIFDILESVFDMFAAENVRNKMSSLIESIPYYNLPILNWFNSSDYQITNVMQEDNQIVEVPLIDVLYNVYNNIEDQLYRSTQEWEISQQKFWRYMKEATGWQLFQFWASALSVILWTFAILLCFCHRKIIIGAILSSQKLEEYNLVKTMPTVQAFDILPTEDPDLYPILTLHPSHEDVLEGVDPFRKTIILATIVLIILGVSLTILFCCYKRCRFASSTLRSCFPIWPSSRIHRGTPKSDIFVEIVEIETGETLWAHFATIGLSPTQIFRHGQLTERDINIISIFKCIRKMQVNWGNAGVSIRDKQDREIKLNRMGSISLWSSGKLTKINQRNTYDVKILGRILDQIMVIQQTTIPPPMAMASISTMGTRAPLAKPEDPPRYEMDIVHAQIHEQPMGSEWA